MIFSDGFRGTIFSPKPRCATCFLKVRHVFLRSAAKLGHLNILNAICYVHMSTHMNKEIYYMILICKYTNLPLKKSIFAELGEIPRWKMIAIPPILINSPFKPFAKIYRLGGANTCYFFSPTNGFLGLTSRPIIITQFSIGQNYQVPKSPKMGGFFPSNMTSFLDRSMYSFFFTYTGRVPNQRLVIYASTLRNKYPLEALEAYL